ncbi:HD domain protein [Raphanus sativus]|nr:HD domain protein [Raphanus sativus]
MCVELLLAYGLLFGLSLALRVVAQGKLCSPRTLMCVVLCSSRRFDRLRRRRSRVVSVSVTERPHPHMYLTFERSRSPKLSAFHLSHIHKTWWPVWSSDRDYLKKSKSAPSSKSHSLADPQIFHRSTAAAASSPNRANHCMAKDSPLSQPDRSGDGSVSLPPPPTASSAIDFLSLSSRLKTTPRAGWVKRELKNPESIADHMYRMGLMALVSTDIPGVNRDKCMKVAIVHDIAEAILGDITPTCGISKEEKKVKHFNTCANSWVEEKKVTEEIAELWRECEANESPEAKVVKDFDKLEIILQALEYEQESKGCYTRCLDLSKQEIQKLGRCFHNIYGQRKLLLSQTKALANHSRVYSYNITKEKIEPIDRRSSWIEKDEREAKGDRTSESEISSMNSCVMRSSEIQDSSTNEECLSLLTMTSLGRITITSDDQRKISSHVRTDAERNVSPTHLWSKLLSSFFKNDITNDIYFQEYNGWILGVLNMSFQGRNIPSEASATVC